MWTKEDKLEAISEKAHEDLLEIGRQAEQMVNMHVLPNTAENPSSNPENAAVNAILRKDPYAHLREKTEMRRDDQGELSVQMKE